MTASEQNGTVATELLLFGDAEAVEASGMPLPSLRVLQAAGAIKAQKVPKENGGFRRMWSEEDVLIASIGAAISEHFAWNVRLVSETMAKTRPGTWSALVSSIAATISSDAGSLIQSSEDDWHVDLVDRRLLFLRVPIIATALFADAEIGQTDLVLGWTTSKGEFRMLPWSLGHRAGRAQLMKNNSPDQIRNAERFYKLAMATRANALSTASINISMQVRAAWRRLHGLKTRFLPEALL